METVFISRDSDGKINGVFANFQKGFAEEELPIDNEEVLAHVTVKE